MKRRWLLYLVIGSLFGVLDFFYLHFLAKLPAVEVFGDTRTGQFIRFTVMFLVLSLGLWLVPVIPVVLSEARVSGSRLLSAVAGLTVWCTGILTYYLTNAAQLAVGVTGREELSFASYGSPYFWQDWRSVLLGDILGGMMEYMAIAMVGGALVGLVASSIYLRVRPQELVA
jgi:uncharacterized membrane protein